MARKDRTTRSKLIQQSTMGAVALLLAVGGCRSSGEEPIVEAHAQALGTWIAAPLGSPAPSPAGTWSLNGTVHTIEGAGTDIWNNADQGHFVYQTLDGDGTITARVVSLENTNSFAKAGVMMRDSLAPGAKNAFALLTPVSANGYRYQTRIATDGVTTKANTGAAAPPNWVRLVRSGANVTAYWSTNGSTFTAIAPAVSVGLGQSILVGLAVTSHTAGTLATGVFDNVTITTPTPPSAPLPPTNVAAAAGNTSVSLTWTASAGATSYDVIRGTVNGGPYPVVNTVTTTSFNSTGLTNGTTYYYRVIAKNSVGPSDPSAQVSATPVAPLWTSKDIGAVGATGSWTLSSGTHTVKAAGADIYGTADAFRYVYQTISGDVTIVAKVQSLTATNAWTKAAVMIRENDTAGAKNVTALLSPTATNKYRLQVRSAASGSTTSTASAGSSVIPSWLKLVRTGNTFTSYSSPDGVNWTAIAPATTVSLSATALVGLAVTSHVSGTLATGVFNSVTVTVPAPPAAPSGVTATGQNKQAFVSWTAAPTATSYKVKRSDTDGGPYTVVGQGIADVSFIDTGLTNGSTYYYVVSAVNQAGEGQVSTQASATPVLLNPSVRTISPLDGALDVSTTGFVSGDLTLPNAGGGVDAATMTSANVFLQKASDGSLIASNLNTSGGGDVVVLQPVAELEPHTLYTFTLTAGLQDATGAAFVPFTSSFTTGDPAPPPPTTIAFDKITLAGVTPREFTSVTIGPDNRLYATSVTGEIQRYPINADGTLGAETTINTLITNNGNLPRAAIGLTFDPAATASNLILWVTHGHAALKIADDWSGKLTKLTGANLATYQDVVINFPRSYKDHMTNSIAFKAGEPGVLYINQGSMNAMGAPDNAWGNRSEHLLAAAVLRLDTAKLGTLPLNIQTNDADPTASGYNPFAPNAPLTIFGAGVRNAYDLVWHSNGQLYVPTNGSAAGGNSPATPSPLPSACTRRVDGMPYTGGPVPGITANAVAEDDFLYKVVQNGYYGHPNPARCEWVLNGGNPTSGVDTAEVVAYPVPTQPDTNWRGAAHNFKEHKSPNGVIEWKSSAVFPQMQGDLLVVRFSGGKDIVRLILDTTTKNVVTEQVGITGFTGFSEPLDLAANPTTGHIYVTDHAAKTITLLRPRP